MLSRGVVLNEMERNRKIANLSIGGLANATNESLSTLRYWLKNGLLKSHDITKGGHYRFNPSAVKRVKKIRDLQSERLTIDEIRGRVANG